MTKATALLHDSGFGGITSRIRNSHQTAYAMAVRNYKIEEPIYKEVAALEHSIRRSLHPRRFSATYVPLSRNKQGVPSYRAWFDNLPDMRPDLREKYKNYSVLIEPSYTMNMGLFDKGGQLIQITFNPNAFFPGMDLRTIMIRLDEVLLHELRHLVDDMNKTHKQPWKHFDPSSDYHNYYNSEHEVDARVTALFLTVNKLFLGSARKLLKENKVDVVTKQHNQALMSVENFMKYMKAIDAELAGRPENRVYNSRLTTENTEEVEGKTREFWKLMREDYGMALRSVLKEDVTEDMRTKWLALLESTKSQVETKTDIKKIVEEDAKITEDKPVGNGVGKRARVPQPSTAKNPVGKGTRKRVSEIIVDAAKTAVKKTATKPVIKKTTMPKSTAKPAGKATVKGKGKQAIKVTKTTKPVAKTVKVAVKKLTVKTPVNKTATKKSVTTKSKTSKSKR